MDNKMIDITTTATLRPDILDVTYTSFKKHMFKNKECRLIINIDPVGDDHLYNQNDVEAMARQHFENVVIRKPEKANFTKALKWVWSQVKTDLFFNLEDDWKLNADLNFPYMVEVMKKFPKLALLRLAKRDSGENWAQLYDTPHVEAKWNGHYFEHPKASYTGMPSLIRTEFIRGLSGVLKDNENHERAVKVLRCQNHPAMADWIFGAYTEKNVSPRLVTNIGIPWRNKRGIKKTRTEKDGAWNWKANAK